MRIFTLTLLILALISWQDTPAVAQVSGSAFGGINTSAGLFGNRTLGQSIGGRGADFGPPGGAVQQAQADAGQVGGSERFLRENRQPGAFVGADSTDATSFFSQLQGGLTGAGLEGLGNRNRDFQNSGQNAGSSRAPLRPRLTLGFNYSGPGETRVSNQLSARLSKLPSVEVLQKVTVAMRGQTAILRGRVATEHDRRMMAQVAMLEPGVSAVENDLQVGQPLPEPVLPLTRPQNQPPRETVEPVPPPIPEDILPPAPRAPRFDD